MRNWDAYTEQNWVIYKDWRPRSWKTWTWEWIEWKWKQATVADMFNESQYPRDQYWFPIRPWHGMNKWDWRSSMKNTYLDQYVARWAKIISGISWNITWAMPINLVNWDDIDSSNFDAFDTQGLWSVNFDTFRNNILPQKIWKLWWRVKNWKLIIPSNWSYFIHYYTEFLHWKWRNTSNLERVFTALYWYSKNWDFLWQIAESVNRSCIWKETVSWTTIQDLKAGEQIQICSMHTNWWQKTLCLWTITIMKLS